MRKDRPQIPNSNDTATESSVSLPQKGDSAGGEREDKWTPKHVKQMLDSWGIFKNLHPSEYKRIADEHNAALRSRLSGLEEENEKMRTAIQESVELLNNDHIEKNAFRLGAIGASILGDIRAELRSATVSPTEK